MPSSESSTINPRKPLPRLKSYDDDGSFLASARRYWQKSYAGDYLGLILLSVAYAFMKTVDEPFHQMFTLDDTRLQHPHADPERVGVCTSS